MNRLYRKVCLSLRQDKALTDTRLGTRLLLASRLGEIGMTVRLTEKRKDVRLLTGLPVALEQATGITRDMSASGGYFWISGKHAVGDKISFTIGLKPERSGLAWKCEGEVVRVEPHGTYAGVAVRIIRSTVEPLEVGG